MTPIKEITQDYFRMDVEDIPYGMWSQVPEDMPPEKGSLVAKIGLNDGDVFGCWVGDLEIKISHKDSIELAGILYEYQQDLRRDMVEGQA